MESDRDDEELFDAVGKRRTAKECNYEGDNHENAVIQSITPERTARPGSDQSFEQNVDRDFDER